MQKKWLLFLTLFITILLTASTVVFAWFTLVERTQPILIYSGSIKLSANLYLVEDETTKTEITESYAFNNVIPGDIYTFELVVKNDGSLNGDLVIDFSFDKSKELLLEHFSIKYLLQEETFNSLFKIEEELDKRSAITITFYVEVLPTLENDMIAIGDFVSIENILITLTQREVGA